MIENNTTRWLIVLTSLITALVYITPNFTEVGESWLFSKTKLNYGLDIQGGLHLVMGVDVDGVLKEKTQRMVKNLPNDMRENAVSFQNVTLKEDTSEIVITVNDQAGADSVVKYMDDYQPGILQVLDNTPQQVVVKYYETQIQTYKQQIVSQSIEVIRNRIDEFGVAEPGIAAQGDNRIIVQLPGIDDANRAKELINRTAKLNFRPVSEEVSTDKLFAMVEEAEKKGKYQLGGEEGGLSYSKYVVRLNKDLESQLPKNTRLVFEKNEAAKTLEAGKVPYLIKTDNKLSGDLLEDAAVRPDEYGKPEVVFRFSVEGRRQFAQMTEENVGKRVAIVLDDIVQSAPVIQEKINSATARITLNQSNYQQSQDEASFIATALRAGALPAALEQLEERTVGPTLGKDSIDKGKKAGILGLILVLVFMLIYYRSLGIVADLSLMMNMVLLLAILTSLGATLTLPGVAGIVLTVGMAVDANVIIFERIKEEIRKGVGTGTAVKDGYGHAFSAIVDANITTAVVCIVLMYFGTGPVRGFAVTLLIGIVTSMFTAIFVSRTIIEFMLSKLKVKKLLSA